VRSCCYLFFSTCLISFNIIPSRFIHVVTKGRISLLKNWIVFHCAYHLFLTHSFTHWWTSKLFPPLGYCWIVFQWSWECSYLFNILISCPLSTGSIVGLLDHMGILSLIVFGASHIVFHNSCILIYMLTSSAQRFCLFHSIAKTCHLSIFFFFIFNF
jgi:hypothetical protein